MVSDRLCKNDEQKRVKRFLRQKQQYRADWKWLVEYKERIRLKKDIKWWMVVLKKMINFMKVKIYLISILLVSGIKYELE